MKKKKILGFKKPQYLNVVWERSSQYSYSPCLNLACHRRVSSCGSNLVLYLPELWNCLDHNFKIVIKSAKIGMQVTSLLVIQCFWPVTSTSSLSSQVSSPFISFIFFSFLSVIYSTKVTLHIRRLLTSLLHIVKLIFKFYVQVFALVLSHLFHGESLHLWCFLHIFIHLFTSHFFHC